MRNKLLLFLAGCAVSFGLACASNHARAAKKPESAPAVAAKETSQATRVVGLKSELNPEPRLLVQTEGNPPYVYYSPQPDVFVIDFAKTAKQPDLAIPSNLPVFVASVAADEAIEADRPLTRVTVRFTRPMTARAAATESGVALAFEEVMQAATETAPELSVTAETVAEVIEPAPMQVPPVVITQETLPADAKVATVLTGLETTGSGATLNILMHANGVLDYKAFRLANPSRLVIDLSGVRNKSKLSTIELGDPFVKRIRIAQFQTKPTMITRVVLDLDEIIDYHAVKKLHGMRIAFGDGPPPAAQPVVASTAPTNGHEAEPEAVEPVEPVTHQTAAEASPLMDPVQTYPVPPSPQSTPAPIPIVTRAQTTASSVTSTPVEDVFVDPQVQSLPGGVMRPGDQRQIGGGERVYTGEPITLNLKDADIKDVLRTFAQLTGLNIAIDPQVSGTVTVQFENVPWDQALELILRQNGLTYVLTGNVMRVGTVERLAQEQQQTRRLEEEERLNVPLQTIIRRLSYAKAGDVQALARELASARGRIIVDPRTNQLIITDVPQYIPTILSLIENIDIPTPQVVIEARIVETTKTFSQSLGVVWNFNASLDPALGTGTGLIFPNRMGIIGGPFNFAAGAPNVLRFTLSDVLGAFDLDIALTAAEQEGLARVISAPKVTTQDNQPAEIQSGVQIPVQTRINFTTTTNYVDATLRLEVTPQITAADTIIMQISVQKTEPGPVAEGAQGPPLNTRSARTRVMVRDGGTAVIGGIYQANDTTNENRVPFVSQIPVVGNLFRGKSITNRHDELLIFITPRIVRST